MHSWAAKELPVRGWTTDLDTCFDSTSTFGINALSAFAGDTSTGNVYQKRRNAIIAGFFVSMTDAS